MKDLYEDPGLLECDAVWLGVWFQMFPTEKSWETLT
jgi:hypothetical protein